MKILLKQSLNLQVKLNFSEIIFLFHKLLAALLLQEKIIEIFWLIFISRFLVKPKLKVIREKQVVNKGTTVVLECLVSL